MCDPHPATEASFEQGNFLVEYTVISIRDHGFPRHDAILAACRDRSRHIAMGLRDD